MSSETITQITQPPEFIEAAAKPFISQLQKDTGAFRTADLSQIYGPQFVAGQDQLQKDAITLAQSAAGLGSYAPFLQTAASRVGPDAYKDFMSPFQKDVIDTTLSEFDRQAAAGRQAIADQAVASGAFGGGREGVQRAEYMASSDRNRAALQAQLLGQAFGQAQQQAGLDFARQMNLAQTAPALAGQQVAGLTSLGGGLQAQRQAELSAQQQLAQEQLQQPLQATQALGSGITGLIAGYPGSQQVRTQPSPSALQNALGLGATLAGIYRVA